MSASPPPPPGRLGAADQIGTVVGFLERIGLSVVVGPVPRDALLPAMTVRDGMLVYDPDAPGWIGDLLHEGGHLAVTDPALRATLPAVGDDPVEEMATLAWSWAAAHAIGMPAETLFHPAYKGGPDHLIAAFAGDAPIGLPMLQYWGMAARADEPGPAYPAMRSWLRLR